MCYWYTFEMEEFSQIFSTVGEKVVLGGEFPNSSMSWAVNLYHIVSCFRLVVYFFFSFLIRSYATILSFSRWIKISKPREEIRGINSKINKILDGQISVLFKIFGFVTDIWPKIIESLVFGRRFRVLYCTIAISQEVKTFFALASKIWEPLVNFIEFYMKIVQINLSKSYIPERIVIIATPCLAHKHTTK